MRRQRRLRRRVCMCVRARVSHAPTCDIVAQLAFETLKWDYETDCETAVHGQHVNDNE